MWRNTMRPYYCFISHTHTLRCLVAKEIRSPLPSSRQSSTRTQRINAVCTQWLYEGQKSVIGSRTSHFFSTWTTITKKKTNSMYTITQSHLTRFFHYRWRVVMFIQDSGIGETYCHPVLSNFSVRTKIKFGSNYASWAPIKRITKQRRSIACLQI